MFDPHALESLEYDRVRRILARFAGSELGRTAAESLVPQTDRFLIDADLAMVAELMALIGEKGDVPLGGLEDTSGDERLVTVQGSTLDMEGLLKIKRTLETVTSLRRYFRATVGQAPDINKKVVNGLTELPDILERFSRIFTPQNEMRDDASPALARILSESRGVHRQLEKQISRILRSLGPEAVLQEEHFTIRNERMVLPVKIEHKGEVKGVMHDRSDSGATVFIEPLETVEVNNQLKELQLAERTERRRIIRELSDTVRGHVDVLARNRDLLTRLDLLTARARMGIAFKGTVPVFSSRIVLKDARHPLLEAAPDRWGGYTVKPGTAVPLNLVMDEDFRTLVISGPNAGGKTVALKTVGLLSLMAQSGIPVPAAEGTELRLFGDMFADIGDEQSIQNSLSTFSSHITHIRHILDHTGPDCLVLVDELCTGTDPELSAALAVAVLETLTATGCTTLVTTHYNALKVFAHHHEGVRNGSMEFDESRIEPTYRFRPGMPGSSFAFETAQAAGLPDSLMARARSLIRTDTRQVEDMVGELERSVKKYAERLARVETEEKRLKARTVEYEAKIAGARQEGRTIVEEAKQAAERILEGANRVVEKAVADIKSTQASKESIVAAKQAVAQARALAPKPAPVKKKKPARTPRLTPMRTPETGIHVWVAAIGETGVIESITRDGRKATVRVHDKLLQLDARTLQRTEAPKPEKRERDSGSLRSEVDLDGMGTEINVIGQRGHEAVEHVDAFLDRAVIAGLKQVRIIHGVGGNVLRTLITKLLKDHPQVAKYRTAELNDGGNGATIVEMR